MADTLCPECGSKREDFSKVCPACGAPPTLEPGEAGSGGNHRKEEEIRTADLEPYIALRYIARLFKVLAALMIVMLIGEVVIGFMSQGRAAIVTLLGEATRLLVLSGLMWSAGDITLLLIDAGHDLRVARILLGRINAQLHRNDITPKDKGPREHVERAPR